MSTAKQRYKYTTWADIQNGMSKATVTRSFRVAYDLSAECLLGG